MDALVAPMVADLLGCSCGGLSPCASLCLVLCEFLSPRASELAVVLCCELRCTKKQRFLEDGGRQSTFQFWVPASQ